MALTAGARTRPHYGGTLSIEIQGDVWAPDGLARRLVLNTLTSLSDSGAAVPALALQWNAQNAGQRWDFQLRPQVRFQDGTSLTADSVVASLKASCAGSVALAAVSASPAMCPWNAVYAAGSSDVVITTVTPMPDLPELMAQTRFAISKQDATGQLEGTGPFRVVGFGDGALTVTANDDCWEGRPFLDSVEIFPHRSIRDQWLDMSVGRADLVQVPPELLGQAQQEHLNVLVSRPVDLLALTLEQRGAFADPALRQAASLAVDRTSLHNVIFERQGEITGSLLPEWLSGYAFLFSIDRDLNRARALRGGAAPQQTTMNTEPASGTLQLAAGRLALNMNEAGFAVQMAQAASNSGLQLRLAHLEEAAPRAALDEMLAGFGQNVTVTGTDPHSLWLAESTALRNHTVIPLLWLPRAWAVGDRLRELRLSLDGEPLLADASLEGAK
jgi:MarR-like DNA-binding transcriptional regulator SgrR of sgrS sRNA